MRQVGVGSSSSLGRKGALIVVENGIAVPVAV